MRKKREEYTCYTGDNVNSENRYYSDTNYYDRDKHDSNSSTYLISSRPP